MAANNASSMIIVGFDLSFDKAKSDHRLRDHCRCIRRVSRYGERATAERLSEQMVQRAIALEGTCTGEHGIGLHKMGFLVDEAGAGAVEMMRTLKRALDPKNIMNPGKIFTA